ncbi:MAG: tripartite tricarboxylate transporter substrate-binding protein [Lachnospiraceae bacterium]|uniref:Tripartite tricarboxylate transporter substrate binding protein n=1 Tax=Hominiventricola filiformis TaxID=2885352 RepID=A0AAE3A6J2_9FIRM|nr:tripartite tricarboxylate transporter substrate-binding protein [Hominiventricola filiformis]MCC2124885.1 tripartite tricarboxylate transporter substrate binding protein [Hominiventricola filiformis]MDY3825927.1 tripartite tricarboxylate transporter substrate-binding protein [Lachnospiraceae bacterium]
MKKKLMATVLAGVMAVSMLATGCGGSKDIKDGKFTPSKSIQWMCTSSAGGGSDIFTRKIGDIMTAENLVNGQTIVVTNKTDGAGEVGRNEVATMKNNADYQLLTFNSGDLMPMVQNTKNRAANFRILAIMAVDKQLLFKGQGAKYDKFEDVIAAVQNGEKVVIGGSKGDDIATYQALVAELGVSEDNLTYITYDSTGDAITAALGGHVEYVISKPAAASEYVEAGSLVPILAFSTERYTGNLADAPTLSELGYNDVEIPVWRGVAAPAAMSDEAAAYWSETLKTVSESDAWKTEYIEANKLIPNYMDTATATEYVTQYEADFMAENGIQ